MLTGRLALVSRGAVGHLQVGLAAAAVLDRLGALSRGGGARQVGKTAAQLLCRNKREKKSCTQSCWHPPQISPPTSLHLYM